MDELITPEQLAEWFQTNPRTLANDRYLGRGVPFVKIGKTVRYKRADVMAYIEANTYSRTDQKVAV